MLVVESERVRNIVRFDARHGGDSAGISQLALLEQFSSYAISKDSADREYGPRCAAKAVAEMDNKEIFGKVLYVKAALKKSEREKELQHETLKYKNSKKRCNLYVKNFLPETTEEDLRNLFSHYGEIESLKLFGQKDNKSPFAFVCFKTPDTAS